MNKNENAIEDVIDLSKVEFIRRGSHITVYVQFTSKSWRTYYFHKFESADKIVFAFLDWCARKREDSAYIVYSHEIYKVNA